MRDISNHLLFTLRFPNPDKPEKQLLVNGQRVRRMAATRKDDKLINSKKKRKCLFTNNQQQATSNFLPIRQEIYK